MDMNALFAISPLDGRYHNKMDSLRAIFSEFGLIKFRTLLEIRWLQTLAKELPDAPRLSKEANHFLNLIIEKFSEIDANQIKAIEQKTNHDVKAIEYFLKEKCSEQKDLSNIIELIHFGCTSEDINNLAYSLMLKSARTDCLLPTLDDIIKSLRELAHQHADVAMLARTHGQPATPTTVGKEFANVVARLDRQHKQLSDISILGKLNGATGNFSALVSSYPEIDWMTLSEKFVTDLNIEWNNYTTQIEPHDYIAEFCHALIRINTILLDLCRDMWGYISLNYFSLKAIKHEVGSSTMPHKVNPIDFENAEGNLGLSNALLDFMALKLPISRWQRDLSDSTVLRNLGVAIGHSLLAFQSLQKGLSKITPNKTVLQKDLDHHWEVLAEPIQMMMRRYHIEEPYEKLKAFTRGKTMTKTMLTEFIETLDLPQHAKAALLKLTPENYLGQAEALAKRI